MTKQKGSIRPRKRETLPEPLQKKGKKEKRLSAWAKRQLAKLGIAPDTPEAKEALDGARKHSRARQKPRGWRKKRKILRKIAEASKRRNRRRT